MKPYAAPPPPGAQPPPLWGSQDYVSSLLGDRVTDITAQRKTARVDRFPTAEAFRDYFKSHYGPTIATYRNVAEHPERIDALDHELAELARRHDRGAGAMGWEYLLFTARKARS